MKKRKETIHIILQFIVLPAFILITVLLTYFGKSKISQQVLNIMYNTVITLFCILVTGFFLLIIIQIPISGMTQLYLLRHLSDEDYEISKMRRNETAWLHALMTYSDDRLDENLDAIADALYNHKICKYFYFHIWMKG